MYADNEKKIYVVLNKKIPLWSTLNAAFHATLALSQRCGSCLTLCDYVTADDMKTEVSQYPVIVLRGKNQDLIRCYKDALDIDDVDATFFIDSMVAASSEEQQIATANRDLNTSDVLGIALFGLTNNLNPIVKRLSTIGSSWV